MGGRPVAGSRTDGDTFGSGRRAAWKEQPLVLTLVRGRVLAAVLWLAQVSSQGYGSSALSLRLAAATGRMRAWQWYTPMRRGRHWNVHSNIGRVFQHEVGPSPWQNV
eukprot:363362-Chlamydomonas_euryale.AAC.13